MQVGTQSSNQGESRFCSFALRNEGERERERVCFFKDSRCVHNAYARHILAYSIGGVTEKHVFTISKWTNSKFKVP